VAGAGAVEADGAPERLEQRVVRKLIVLLWGQYQAKKKSNSS
jgi:hypothetical protein